MTVLALVLSVIYQASGGAFIHSGDVVDVSLRRVIVYTLAFYVLVGAGLLTFVLRARVRFVWQRKGVERALLLGLPLGAAGGLLGVAVNSAASGHLASDPRVTAMVGGGGVARLFLTFAIVSVLAPLVEETIFRGICAGSLLARGTAPAVWVSAIAFSIWHLNPAALRYYAVMGIVFAAIWLKRGLLASMSAHAAFNGVLAIAAVMATSGAPTDVTFDDIAVTVPGGWHVDPAHDTPNGVIIDGPAGSALLLMRQPADAADDPTTSDDGVVTGDAGLRIDPSSIIHSTTRLGPAVSGDVRVRNQPGHVMVVTYHDTLYEVFIITAGNPAAEHSWRDITTSLRPA